MSELDKVPFITPLHETQPSVEAPNKPPTSESAERLVYLARDKRTLGIVRKTHELLYKGLAEPKTDHREEIRRIEQIEALEIMAVEEPQNVELLGVDDPDDSGVNATSRVEFTDSHGRLIVAYMKPANGEAAFDSEGYPMEFDVALDTRVRVKGSVPEPAMVYLNKIWSSEVYFRMYADGLRAKYGIPESEAEAFEAQLKLEVGSPRIGVEPGGGAVREKVVYDQSKMLGFDVVTATALRRQTEKVLVKGAVMERVIGVSSVQEAVVSPETGEPGRQLYQEEVTALLFQSSDQWAEVFQMSEEQVEKLKKSLVEIACLHWLTGQLDGHLGNILLMDDGSLKAIDNGLSYSKKRGVDVNYIGVPTGMGGKGPLRMDDNTKGASQFRSVPMEVLSGNTELKLSDEQRAKLMNLHYTIVGQGGPEATVVKQMFEALFPNQRIAATEMKLFLERLEVLMEIGRPPAEAFSSEKLFPIGFMSMQNVDDRENAKAKIEAKRKAKKTLEYDVDLSDLEAAQ